MPLRGRFVHICPDLREFFGKSDYLIANLEGIISKARKKGLFSPSDQRQDKRIIGLLSGLFPPERTYLSVANNHAEDYGEKAFLESIALLESQNFRVFGWNERPFFDINESIRIVSGTMWSNRTCEYIAKLKIAGEYTKPAAFNILYPHFGYEHELYPRPEIVTIGRKLIQQFDAVLGHHSHCPQAVTIEPIGGTNRLLAYSLGNFIGAFRARKYQSGIALKLEVGQDQAKAWLVGKVEWRLIKCAPLPDGEFILS